MKAQPKPLWDRETTLVTQLAAGASLVAFLFYFRHGDLLLYGDAVAHINIARRVFDSRTPGLLQLGTVWLPLPHLLIMPFIVSDSSWQTGIGGSIPSMFAYVLGTAGIFRLVRSVLAAGPEPDPKSRIAGWLAAMVYAANPNLLYMQSTAMTEPLYLGLFVWSIVHFSEFKQRTDTGNERSAASSLTRCGICVVAACLTRYDGWFLAGASTLAALLVVVKHRHSSVLRVAFVKFVILVVSAPVLWLGYNGAVYRNPLEFANGPYSAKAIEQRVTVPGYPPPYSGWHDLRASFSYFLKATEDNLAQGKSGRVWVAALLIGLAVASASLRKRWPALLLILPLPFYMLSIAYGSVPIYLPEWWPFSFYNVRFGLELIPAFAVFSVLAVFPLLGCLKQKQAIGVIGGFVVLVGISYGFVWKAQPICYREASVNGRARVAFETTLASNLQLLPHDSTLLMYLGDHVGALQRARIPLRRTINEGNHHPWKQPDPEGLWEQALADPRQFVDYVIAFDGDPVATGVQKRDLKSMLVIRTNGQPPATIYWTARPLR